MLKLIVLEEEPQPVSAQVAADRFPPVLDHPKAPVTRGDIGGFADLVLGKGRIS
jgi:hypothetical protein